MNNRRVMTTVLAAGLTAASWSSVANSTPLMGAMHGQKIKVIRISNDRGGYVIQYALRLQEMREAGTRVEFKGGCLSACTLYLALPKSQTCVSPRASFSFHAAYGAGPKGNRIATSYMLKKYPSWVRDWISSHGGLSRKLITMQANYASNYMRPCETRAVQNELRGFSKRG
jgi:hypothetical protein